jgi:hypothetical protein
MLAQIERAQGQRTDKELVPVGGISLKKLLERLGLDHRRAVEIQRIGTLPDDELLGAMAGLTTPAIPRRYLSAGASDIDAYSDVAARQLGKSHQVRLHLREFVVLRQPLLRLAIYLPVGIARGE